MVINFIIFKETFLSQCLDHYIPRLFQWMDGPLLTGLLTFPTMPSDKLPESSHSALPPSIVQTLFSARVLTKATNPASMATTPGEEKDAEEEAGLSEEVSGLDLVGEEDMVVLLNTAFAAAFCRAVLGSRAKVKGYGMYAEEILICGHTVEHKKILYCYSH